MKIAEMLPTSSPFAAGVTTAIKAIAGDYAELASLILENTPERRRLLVATQSGVIDCTFAANAPVEGHVGPPIVCRLTPWSEWSSLRIQVRVYVSSQTGHHTEWDVTGWPRGIELGERVDNRSLAEFVRECVRRREASHREEVGTDNGTPPLAPI